MKLTTLLRTAGVALALTALTGQAAAGGRHHHKHHHHWRGSYSGLWIGTGLGLAAAGTYLAFSSRPFFGQVSFYGSPYAAYPAPYAAYSYPAPYAATPAYAAPAPAPVHVPDDAGYTPFDPSAYTQAAPQSVPAGKRDANRQARARDDAQCRRQAMNESGFDPDVVTPWTTGVSVNSYRQAYARCLAGNG